MTGSSYERELKELLEADRYDVTRAAGSHGVDLVVRNPRTGSSMDVEVKSFTGKAFYTSRSKKLREQNSMLCNRDKEFKGAITVRYALRQKNQANGNKEFRFILPERASKPYNWGKEGKEGKPPIKPIKMDNGG